MKIAQIQFDPWDKIYNFEIGSHNFKIGDSIIIKTETGVEIGKVIGLNENNCAKAEEINCPKAIEKVKTILRKANLSDLDKIKSREKNRSKDLEICRELIKKHNLPAKLVDIKFSFDGGRITFIFTARERIDFRALVKDLTKVFQKSIRMQQIGVREEAKAMGGIGFCGRELCCLKFLKTLGNISTDFISDQNLNHRGAERLSGPCGRLMCCLAYEEKLYKELSAKLPAMGSKMKTKEGEGRVIGHNVLKQTVKVQAGDNIIEVPIK